MKRTITIIIATLAGIAALYAQQRNDTVTASRNIKESTITLTGIYDEIDVTGSIKVILTDGTQGSVRVEAADNIMPLLDIFVKGSTLNISYKAGYSYRDSSTTVYVPADRIEEISVAGASHVHSNVVLRGKELDITLMGTAMFEGSVNVGELGIEQLGNTTCNISATCTEAEIDISGTSSLKGNMTVAGEAEIDASGSSRIELQGSCREMDLDMSANASLSASRFKAADIKGSITGSATADVTNTGRLAVNCSGNATLVYDKAVQVNDSRTTGNATVKARTKR